MKKDYRVVWADPARLDLFEIIQFIADDSSLTARKILKKIREKVSDLYVSPQRGRLVPELVKQGITKYRELIIQPWRVLYQIDGKIVYIVLVIDSRRNLEDLLFRRIIR